MASRGDGRAFFLATACLRLACAGATEGWEPQFVRAAFCANFAEAMQIGIFGAPSYVVSGELFFGQDRLEDAVGWASQ